MESPDREVLLCLQEKSTASNPTWLGSMCVHNSAGIVATRWLAGDIQCCAVVTTWEYRASSYHIRVSRVGNVRHERKEFLLQFIQPVLQSVYILENHQLDLLIVHTHCF